MPPTGINDGNDASGAERNTTEGVRFGDLAVGTLFRTDLDADIIDVGSGTIKRRRRLLYVKIEEEPQHPANGEGKVFNALNKNTKLRTFFLDDRLVELAGDAVKSFQNDVRPSGLPTFEGIRRFNNS